MIYSEHEKKKKDPYHEEKALQSEKGYLVQWRNEGPRRPCCAGGGSAILS